MKTVEQNYLERLESFKNAELKMPFFSSVTGKKVDKGSQLGALYWTQNLTSPVLFSTAMETLSTHITGRKVFLEIGPNTALMGPILRHSNTNAEYVPTLNRGEDAVLSLLNTAGNLFLQSVIMKFEEINPGLTLVDLPNYPWHHDARYWDESRPSKGLRLRKYLHHDNSRLKDCRKHRRPSIMENKVEARDNTVDQES